jgi:hypothetical protein
LLWWVILVLLLDVFADTPTGNQLGPPSTSFSRGAPLPLWGSATLRLATLASAPPPPQAAKADGRKTIYRNEFTPTRVTQGIDEKLPAQFNGFVHTRLQNKSI